jgi:hypothetical protein
MQATIHDPHLGTTGGNDDGDWQPTGGRRPFSAAQRAVVVGLVLAVLAAGAVLGLRSGGKDGSEASSSHHAAAPTTHPSTTAGPATTEPANQAPATPAPAPTPAPGNDTGTGTDTSSEEAASLEDGRHPVYLTGIDTSAGTVEFDLVQWLTEDDAAEYVEAHEDEYPGLYDEIEETGMYPYDELVVNENPRLRTLPVAPDTQPMVLMQPNDTIFSHSIPFVVLPAYFDEFQLHDGDHLSYFVFWLTVRHGEIVAMEEQFQS